MLYLGDEVVRSGIGEKKKKLFGRYYYKIDIIIAIFALCRLSIHLHLHCSRLRPSLLDA